MWGSRDCLEVTRSKQRDWDGETAAENCAIRTGASKRRTDTVSSQ